VIATGAPPELARAILAFVAHEAVPVIGTQVGPRLETLLRSADWRWSRLKPLLQGIVACRSGFSRDPRNHAPMAPCPHVRRFAAGRAHRGGRLRPPPAPAPDRRRGRGSPS
jgi:hypothetical protein